MHVFPRKRLYAGLLLFAFMGGKGRLSASAFRFHSKKQDRRFSLAQNPRFAFQPFLLKRPALSASAPFEKNMRLFI
jgi:hypothetical protein